MEEGGSLVGRIQFEEKKVVAAAGGIMGGLLLGWFLELGHLGASAAPIAVDVGAHCLFAEIMPRWGEDRVEEEVKDRKCHGGDATF